MPLRTPTPADVILRGDSSAGFELVWAVSGEPLQSGIPTLEEAVEAARAHGARAIWQQSFDNRGRALGDPVRLVRLDPPPTEMPN